MSTGQIDLNANSGGSSAAPQRPAVEHGQLASGTVTGAIFAAFGALLAWGLLIALYPVFEVPSELFVDQPNAAQAAALQAAQDKISLRNSVFVLGLFGALLAGAMAVGEGWARRSGKMALAGFLGCGLAGALFGGFAAWAGESVCHYARLPGQPTIDLEGTVVVQMTMFAVLGGGVGLALGCLTRHVGSTFSRLLGGVLAGVFAGMVYPIAAAYLLPTAQTEQIIPRGNAATLLWFGTAAIFLGLVVPEMKIRRTPAKAKPEPEPSATSPTAADLLAENLADADPGEPA